MIDVGSGGGISWPTGKLSTGSLPSIGEEKQREYEAEINEYFQKLLTNFNDRDQDAINRHLDTILQALVKEIEIIKLLYGGSISKNTYIDGLSDIDILAIVSEKEGVNSPKDLIDYFAKLLQERLPFTSIKKGNLAVTVVFSDGHEIQILPALTTKTGIRIANYEGNTWSNVVRPEAFARKLSEINQKNGYGAIPVIKLFKALNVKLPKENRLTGYHIESIAIEAFNSYNGPKTRKEMLMHFTNFASKQVLDPIRDKTGQSINVDDYLGDSNSEKRQMINASLTRLYKRMKTADDEKSVETWKSLIEE